MHTIMFHKMTLRTTEATRSETKETCKKAHQCTQYQQDVQVFPESLLHSLLMLESVNVTKQF